MKHCIWCNRTSDNTSFQKKAHVVPQTLGGAAICDNVCDECNAYFGKKTSSAPAIEEVIKETFHISRLRFLVVQNEIGKNKAVTKPDSLFFKIDLKKHKVTLKPAYRVKPYFQEKLCRLIKRGLIKMFLEESERQFKNGNEERYNFIREFARYDLGDYPVLYFQRKYGVILQELGYAKSPRLYLRPEERNKYLLCDHGFHEFEFLGHVFAVPTSRSWDLTFHTYKKETEAIKKNLFTGFKVIENFNDINLTLRILN